MLPLNIRICVAAVWLRLAGCGDGHATLAVLVQPEAMSRRATLSCGHHGEDVSRK